MDERRLLTRTAELAADYLDSLDERSVGAPGDLETLTTALDLPLPDEPTGSLEVVERLAADAERGIVASQSGRYFGFVVGAAHPAALAADWLVSTWDQNLGLLVLGPSALVMENTAGRWCKELLGIPPEASFAFVTGCQMAHVTCLAAARQHVLDARGWDVREQGLAGSPPITVVVGAEGHSTVPRALRYLGIGLGQIRSVPADREGRMDVAALETVLDAEGDAPTIVCAQAGGVNTGAFDDIRGIADVLSDTAAWLHIDGAFGLWAAASPALRHLVEGHERADSWATDAHKWLNVPYDCGIAFCSRPEPHRKAMTAAAAYYVRDPDETREPLDWTPDHSRPGQGGARVCRPQGVGASRGRRARRLVVPPREAARRRHRNDPRLRGAQRRRAEPGAVPACVGRGDRGRSGRGAGERGGMDEPDHLGRADGHPALGVVLAHERRRRRAHGVGVPRRRRAPGFRAGRRVAGRYRRERVARAPPRRPAGGSHRVWRRRRRGRPRARRRADPGRVPRRRCRGAPAPRSGRVRRGDRRGWRDRARRGGVRQPRRGGRGPDRRRRRRERPGRDAAERLPNRDERGRARSRAARLDTGRRRRTSMQRTATTARASSALRIAAIRTSSSACSPPTLRSTTSTGSTGRRCWRRSSSATAAPTTPRPCA